MDAVKYRLLIIIIFSLFMINNIYNYKVRKEIYEKLDRIEQKIELIIN